MRLLDDECELSELKLLPLEQGLLDEIDELLIWERQLEEEQAELLGNPLLLQLDEQQEVKLSDQQLHEELDEKENLDELLLDDDDRLLELLQVEPFLSKAILANYFGLPIFINFKMINPDKRKFLELLQVEPFLSKAILA